MRGPAYLALLILAGIAIAGCAPRYRYHERGYRDPYGYRTEHEMTDDDAWEIVRRDPCRYDEYRRFAEKHKNPERRRDVVWRLAREGCSREHAYDYDSDR